MKVTVICFLLTLSRNAKVMAITAHGKTTRSVFIRIRRFCAGGKECTSSLRWDDMFPAFSSRPAPSLLVDLRLPSSGLDAMFKLLAVLVQGTVV
jgi:hypothetical protein